MSSAPLGPHLGKDLDPRAIDEVWQRIEARRSGHSWRAGARWGATFAFSLTVIGAVFLWRRGPSTTPEATALHVVGGADVTGVDTQEAARQIELDDGSRVSVAAGSSLRLTHNDGHAVSWSLPTGDVWFDVTPGGPRRWVIDAGLARVSVLGTRFRVQHVGDRVHVEVERGSVSVEPVAAPEQKRTLGPGDRMDVEPISPAGLAAITPDSLPLEPAEPRYAAVPKADAGPSLAWREAQAEHGAAAAFELLGEGGVARETARATSVADLVALADVARLSGHPAEAVAPLQRVLDEHAGDARASAAAFTLGKIQLDVLGAPAAAAAAFERAVTLGLPRALREDAFARRAEAHHRAGHVEAARAARVAYEREFPGGRFERSMATWAP